MERLTDDEKAELKRRLAEIEEKFITATNAAESIRALGDLHRLRNLMLKFMSPVDVTVANIKASPEVKEAIAAELRSMITADKPTQLMAELNIEALASFNFDLGSHEGVSMPAATFRRLQAALRELLELRSRVVELEAASSAELLKIPERALAAYDAGYSECKAHVVARLRSHDLQDLANRIGDGEAAPEHKQGLRELLELRPLLQQREGERNQARYLARCLAHAYINGARPMQRWVDEAIAFDVDQRPKEEPHDAG